MKISISAVGACSLTVLLATLLYSAPAQQTATKPAPAKPRDASSTQIKIASNSGPPGSMIVLPIYFTPGEGVEAGQLKLEISFAGTSLKFEKVEEGTAAKSGGVAVSGEAKVAKNAAGATTSTVNILASVGSADTPSKGIPQGMLAVLSLRITGNARPGTIALRTKAEGEELKSNAPLRNVTVSASHIEIAWVDAPPSVSCFFFSH